MYTYTYIYVRIYIYIYIDFNVFFSIVIRILSIGSGNNLLDLDDLIMHYR